MDYQQIRFISQEVEVEFNHPPTLKKKPGCPDRFNWENNIHEIRKVVGEWQDFSRRGRMAHNMRPANAAKARRRGSWGVGRFYFRVRTASGQYFELYYDRAPQDADDRGGSWVLFREIKPAGSEMEPP